MDITFSSFEAFKTAESTWSKEKELYLVTFHAGCGLDSYERAYHKVTSLKFLKNTKTVVLSYEDVEPTAMIKEGQIAFGSDAISDVTRHGVIVSHEKRSLNSPAGQVGTRPIPALMTLRMPVTTSNPYRRRSGENVNVGVGFGIADDDEDKCPKVDAKIDLKLDSKLKMVSLEDPINENILDGLSTTKTSARERIKRQERRRMARSVNVERGLSEWVLDKLTRAADAVTQGIDRADSVIDRINAAFERVGGRISRTVAAIESINQRLKDGGIEFTPLDRKIQFDFPTPDQLAAVGIEPPQDLPQFGYRSGFPIARLNESTIYCVECYAWGDLAFSGTIAFTLKDGLTKANVLMTGALYAGVHIGLDMKNIIEHKIVQPLINSKYSGYRIPGILDFDAFIKAQVDYSVKVTAQTQLVTGVAMRWPQINTKFDLINGGEDDEHFVSSGWGPTVEKLFMIDQDTKVAAEVVLPFRIGLGFKIFEGLFKKEVSITEVPRIKALTGVSFGLEIKKSDETGLPDIDASLGSDECPSGIPVELSFSNDVILRGLPRGKRTLHKIEEAEIFQECIAPQVLEVALALINGERTTDLEAQGPQKRGTLPILKRQNITTSRKPNTKLITIENRLDDTFVTTNQEGQILLDTHNRNCSEPTKFVAMNGIAVSDSSNRLVHLYSNEIEEYGVSRLRVHPASSIPEKAKIVMFTTSNETSTSIVGYVPGDASKTPYFPIVCAFENAPSKFFIAPAKDVDKKTGEYKFDKIFKILEDDDNEEDLTGGEVLDCSLKALTFQAPASEVKTLEMLRGSAAPDSFENLPMKGGVYDVPLVSGPWGPGLEDEE
ncbi:hypothetical protein ABW19_dt0208007 [Dactylella cylindrospora]|nr:hypothetical protein ABW19_dt0208007 [Dactylella cylindrospora]